MDEQKSQNFASIDMEKIFPEIMDRMDDDKFITQRYCVFYRVLHEFHILFIVEFNYW